MLKEEQSSALTPLVFQIHHVIQLSRVFKPLAIVVKTVSVVIQVHSVCGCHQPDCASLLGRESVLQFRSSNRSCL